MLCLKYLDAAVRFQSEGILPKLHIRPDVSSIHLYGISNFQFRSSNNHERVQSSRKLAGSAGVV